MVSESQNETGNPADASATRTSGRMRIVWDDSDMKSAYANVTQVTGGREEIMLIFGMNQPRPSEQKAFNVKISDRIVMNPYAAKRFSNALAKAIEDYEHRYGTVELEVSRPAGVTLQ